MISPDRVTWWRQLIGESLWKKRGVVKTVHLWLPIAAIATVCPISRDALTLTRGLQLLVAASCYVLVSILANDLMDRRDDDSVGKQRPITEQSPKVAWMLVALITALGGLVLFLSDMPRTVLLAYGAAIIVGLLYSLRPVRFKERGFLGPMTYSLSTCLAYLIVPWVGLQGDYAVLASLAPAMLLEKWMHLHFHQVVDSDADSHTYTQTITVMLGLARARSILRWVACLASLAMLWAATHVVLRMPTGGWVVSSIGVASAVTVAFYVFLSRRRPERASLLLRELPWHYLALSYAVFRVLPLALLVLLSLEDPARWVLFILAAATVLLEMSHAVGYRYE